MRLSFKASYLARAALVAVVGVSLCNCSSLRKAAGMNKMPPDEFTVLTKGPLIMPPDFGLMPPKPGAAPTNQSDPATNAQASLYGTDPAAIAASMQGPASSAEKLLLANAGVANADPDVRQHLASDLKSQLATDDSFTKDILFWQEKKKPEPGKLVDADAEAKRIAAQRDAGKAVNGGAGPKPDEDDSGWFDGWFDWL